jgi:predicted nucleotidyltransferase
VKDLTDVIHDLATLFDRLSLPYAIMGGIAVRAYGLPRPTYDVDFTLAVPRDRLRDLFTAVAELGYSVPTAYEGGWVDQVGGMPLVKIRLYLDGKGIDADVFLAETAFQQEVIARRVTCDVEGQRVSLVTAEDLILFKLIANRPRDLIDVQDVLFIQGDLDEDYMRRWAAELNVTTKLGEALSERQ